MANRHCWVIISLVAVATCHPPPPPPAPTPCTYEANEVASWHLLTYAAPPGYPGCVAPYYNFETSTITSEKGILYALEVSDTRIYVSNPRVLGPTGYPCTLCYVDKPAPGCSLAVDTPLQAYPSWDWHQDAESGVAECNCTALVSVSCAQIDRCNRLWALDSGHSNVRNLEKACPPKLVIYDLNTDKHVRSMVIPPNVDRPGSFLAHFVLDESANDPTCENTRAYITDALDPGVVVYDGATNAIIRRSSPKMYANPDCDVFTAPDGRIYQSMIGTHSTLPTPALESCYPNSAEITDLYFHAYAGKTIYKATIDDMISTKWDALQYPTLQPLFPVKNVTTIPSQTSRVILSCDDKTLIFETLHEGTLWSFDPCTGNLEELVTSKELLEGVWDIACDSVGVSTMFLTSANNPDAYNGTISSCNINHRIVSVTQQQAPGHYPQPNPHPGPPPQSPHPGPPQYYPQHEPQPSPPQQYSPHYPHSGPPQFVPIH